MELVAAARTAVAGLRATAVVLFLWGAAACGPADPFPRPAEDGPEGTSSPPTTSVPEASEQDHEDLGLSPEIRSRLDAHGAGFPFTAGGRRILASETLPEVYEGWGFQAIWVGAEGLGEAGRTVLSEIRAAEDHGLNPSHYHLSALDSLLGRLDEGEAEDRIRRRVDVDLLLTDAVLVFGSHLLHGRLDPTTIEPAWTAARNGVELGELLLEALEASSLSRFLADLRPDGDRYPVLQEMLRRYRRIVDEGGWGEVPAGETLDPGMRSARVTALRERLAAEGRLAGAVRSPANPELYDEALAEDVRAFQRDHGLSPDARVGPATLAALNVPATARLDQMLVNLERWRWLPREMGDRYILVNIAGFTVSVVDDGRETMRLRAVVGTQYRQTPVFSARMTYLALAPYWNVPPGIARNDQLPRIREDPGYVAGQNMVLFENATNRIVDPHSVSWAGMTGTEFNRRFRLRQEPGPNNALGNVKFMFPNRHNVYLHDTPARELFERPIRGFSSGCIRVDRAMDLAEHLLRDDPLWTRERMQQAIGRGREQTVTLPRPYQVHLQYWTAWVEPDGRIQFREDLYNRDRRVRAALENPPPRIF
jgi:L,D-transpeptidase YcbB